METKVLLLLLTCFVMDTSAEQVDENQSLVGQYRDIVKGLARQLMSLQFNMEERIRSDGDSGIKGVRGLEKGPDNYYENGIMGGSVNSIHDHSNYERSVGMGEVIAVLNGVEFRTRHNDYKLQMAHTSSRGYHRVEDIPFPDVPPAVTDLETVDEQITEMRKWFKAFKDQDASERNYTQYFKPVLCYMEGAWTLDDELDEPFSSDRHSLDATSWADLLDKIRISSYTGTKSRLENFAYLPTTIMSVNETSGIPTYAQWNYRILCSPLKENIPLSDFRLANDLQHRFPRKKSYEQMYYSRGARFRLYENEDDEFTEYSKIDRLFYTIPGKDNIPADDMTQASFGDAMFDLGKKENVQLNTGYYHRYFRFDKAGAMGLRSAARGFNDANMWVAQTSQERVAPMEGEVCSRNRRLIDGKLKWSTDCETFTSRFSYAIPLEIIYLTPLQRWNPYDIETGKNEADVTQGKTLDGDSEATAFDGSDNSRYYLTPLHFFKSDMAGSDPADTVKSSVFVRNKNGNVEKTAASGVQVVLRNIEDVGEVRLRYPISPLHGEGSAVWKELNALKKVVQDQLHPVHDTVSFAMSKGTLDGTEHEHEFTVTKEQYTAMLKKGRTINAVTTYSHDHRHKLQVYYNTERKQFEYSRCDKQARCSHNHPVLVTQT